MLIEELARMIDYDANGKLVLRSGKELADYSSQVALNGKAAAIHDHNDLYYTQTALDTMLAAVQNGATDWGAIGGILANQTDLQSELDAKALTSHDHDGSYSTIGHNHTGVYEPANANVQSHIANTSNPHSVTKAQVGLSNVDNTSDVGKPVSTATQTALDGKSAIGHNHDSAYSAIGHNHAGVYEPANANIQTHVASAHAPPDAQKNSDITKAEIEAKLTGSITTHTHPSGSDPWTYVKITSDFSTTSATAQAVTGLSFVPAANTTYIIEGIFMTRTATTTVGPRIGITWPTGCTDGVGGIQQTSSATANNFANGNITAAMLSPVGGLPTTTSSYPSLLWGTIVAGASPGGSFQINLASETAGTSVTMKSQSWIRYRTI